LERGALLGLACALVVWLAVQWQPVHGLEDWMLDGCFNWRFSWYGPRPTQAKVILVALDDPSLDQLGKPLLQISPELAEVVTFAHKQRAAAIGLDYIIPEALANLPEFEERQRGDATKLGAAIAEAGIVVLAEWKSRDPLTSEERWLLPLPQWRFKHLMNPELTDLGFANITADPDHFLRRQTVFANDNETKQGLMHFALALYARATGVEPDWHDEQLWLAGQLVPLEADQTLRVNYVGPPGSFPTIPLQDVLTAARGGKPLAQDLSGAVVIIGSAGGSDQDLHATPFSNNYFRTVASGEADLMPGPEFHAHILATLIDRAYVRWWPWLTPLLLLVVGPLLGVVYTHLNLEAGFVVAFAHHWAWKGVCLAAFRYAHLRVEIIPMLLLGFLAYGAVFGLRWRRLRSMLGVVQSEAIARVLEALPGRLGRQGEERTVTVLFSDIRSFTDFSESHTPQEVVTLLNAYFGAMAPIIEAHGGTLNKYIGDGIMVFYGAPEARDDHALRAVRTAVAMVRKVHELKELWAKLGNPTLRIGVGVHTGKAVVGTVGSPRRLEYTAIGDTVNAAARIESENKLLHTEVLISAETYQALPPNERAALGFVEAPTQVKVKGRESPLLLYPIPVP
jgi:adenylate cyclase